MNFFAEYIPLSWDWIWRTTLQVSILICIIRLVQLVFRKKLSARWLYALWLLVIIRMVMPVGMETVWSVYNLFKVDEAEPATYYFLTPMTQPISPVVYDVAPVPEPVRVLPWVWGFGVFFFGVHLWSQWRKVKRQIKHGTPVRDGELRRAADDAAGEFGLKSAVPIVESEEISVPGLFGMFRPTLIVPKGFSKNLSEEELRLVFLHEWAHVKRRDVFVNGIMTMLQVLHWFNPLVWYAFMRMRSDREMACDALVMDGLNEIEAEQYGNTLLKLMARHHGLRPIPGMVGVLENKAGLKRRIIAIAGFSRRSYRWSLSAIVLLSIVGSITLTQAKHEQQNPADEAGDETKISIAENDVDATSMSDTDPERSTDEMTVRADRVKIDVDTGRLTFEGNVQTPITPIVSSEVENPDSGADIQSLPRLIQVTADRGELRNESRTVSFWGNVQVTTTPDVPNEKAVLDTGSEGRPFPRRINVTADQIEADTDGGIFRYAGNVSAEFVLGGGGNVIAKTPASTADDETASESAALDSQEPIAAVASENMISRSYVFDEMVMKQIVFSDNDGELGVSDPDTRIKNAKHNLEKWLSQLAYKDVSDSVVWNSFECDNGDCSLTLTSSLDMHVKFSQLLERIGKPTEPLFDSDEGFGGMENRDGNLQIGDGSSRTLKAKRNLLDGYYERERGLGFVEQRTTVNVKAEFSDDVTTFIEVDPAPQRGIGTGVTNSKRREPGPSPPTGSGVVRSTPVDSESVAQADSVAVRSELAAGTGEQRVHEILETIVSITYQDTHISEILIDFKEQYGLPSMLDQEKIPPAGTFVSDSVKTTYVTDGLVTYIHLKDVALRDAVKAVCRPLKLDYTVRDGAVWISERKVVAAVTPPTSSDVVESEPRNVKPGEKEPEEKSRIESILDSPVGVVFEKIHLSDVLDFITSTYDLNIMVDKRVVPPPRWEPDPNKDSEKVDYVTDGYIQYVNLKEISLREALKSMLRPLGLTYTVESSFIWISTPDNIRHESFEELETRRYNLSDSWIEHISKNGGAVRAAVGKDGGTVEEIMMLTVAGKARIDYIIPPIYEPGTRNRMSFIHVNLKEKNVVIHNSPRNLDAFGKYLDEWDD
jgi:bla regulator protein BlaR1